MLFFKGHKKGMGYTLYCCDVRVPLNNPFIFVYKTTSLLSSPHVPVARSSRKLVFVYTKSPDGKSDRSRDRFKSYGCIYLFTHTDNKKQIT